MTTKPMPNGETVISGAFTIGLFIAVSALFG
jgi:hypothetical protein